MRTPCLILVFSCLSFSSTITGQKISNHLQLDDLPTGETKGFNILLDEIDKDFDLDKKNGFYVYNPIIDSLLKNYFEAWREKASQEPKKVKVTSPEIKLDTLGLLLGLTNDYLGKTYIPGHPKESILVTYFFSSEKEQAALFTKFLKGLDEKNEGDIVVKQESKDSFIKIYSKKYSNLFNTYYKFKKDKNNYYEDASGNEYQTYSGKLQMQRFKSSNQELSFLLGSYLKHGTMINEKIVQLKYGNSISHFKIAKKIIQKYRMKLIDDSISKNTMPTVQKISFYPSFEFKVLIDSI